MISPDQGIRRIASWSVIAAIVISIGFSPGIARAYVDPLSSGASREAVDLEPDTTAKVTGGGTVLATPTYPNTVASFGVNARRPVSFGGGGFAEGRINYDRHRNTTGRHINVPVTLMEAVISSTPTPNGTGGRAALAGDCTLGTTCPPGDASVIVYLEDNSDSVSSQDVFKIYFCEIPAFLPPPTFTGGSLAGCDGPEGGNLRSGNIQVRSTAGEVGEQMATAASAGIFPASANFNGVELAGGVFGVGVRRSSSSANGDVQVQFTGMSTLGLSQQVTISVWVTSATIAGGTATINGTAVLDMGEGPPPTGGHPVVLTLTATGLTVSIDGTTLPTLPKTDGFINIE